jgi:hypothetical protein
LDKAYEKLTLIIPETAQFTDFQTGNPVIMAYDLDFSEPLEFMYGSDDLLLKTSYRQVLCEPIRLIDAVIAAIADPFAYSPRTIYSHMYSDDCEYDQTTGLISGIMHASPPTFSGLAAIISQ